MKLFCVGRNYAEHARELNNAIPDAPVIFMKPATAMLKGNIFYIPDFSHDMHYECELIYRISKNGKYIDEQFAANYIDAISVGIDFTARDLQQNQKQKGLPWEISKAFDNSAVAAEFTSLSNVSNQSAIKFSMQLNGKTVQQGDSSLMIFSIEKIIAYISSFFTLQQGDLIYTGTPAGVGAIKKDDVLEGYLFDEKKFELQVR